MLLFQVKSTDLVLLLKDILEKEHDNDILQREKEATLKYSFKCL